MLIVSRRSGTPSAAAPAATAVAYAFAHEQRLLERREPEQHGELLSAEPPANVGSRAYAGEHVADHRQHAIAHMVAEAVIDGLEVIRVEIEHRAGALSLAQASPRPGRARH